MFSTIVVVVMENHDYDQIIGSPDAPYINALAHRSALATNYRAVNHPSLPNYLALLGGSTFGIASDCTDCSVSGRSLVDELEARGISWKAYMEDLPSPCFTGPQAGSYAKKHDPFMYFEDIRTDPTRCRNVVPFTVLAQDLAHRALPRFAFITPNECHDMHDCSVGTGDAFLADLLPRILSELGPTGVLLLTWDEGHPGPSATGGVAGCCPTAAGGRVATIAAGPTVTAGTTSAVALNHYSLLRTIEDAWKLPRLGLAACSCTQPLDSLFRSG